MVVSRSGHVDGDDAGKVAGPLWLGEVVIVAGRDDVDAVQISFINPLFVLEYVLRQTTTETAIKNCVTAVKRLPYPLTNDRRAGIEVLTQDAYASDFSIRGDRSDDAGDSGAVAEKVGAIARPCLNVQPRINNVNIVPKL
jgi:hypothetical protein